MNVLLAVFHEHVAEVDVFHFNLDEKKKFFITMQGKFEIERLLKLICIK